MAVNEYSVDEIRLIVPKGKVAEKNPDRWGTVRGKFHRITNGKVDPEVLTFSQKDIDWETAGHPDFSLDIKAGLLTLPAGERGRKAAEGASADTVAEMLAAARERANGNSDAEEDAEEGTEEDASAASA